VIPNPSEPVVLAIDTSAAVSSVALCNVDTVFGRAQLAAKECRGETLGSMVDGLLEAGFADVGDLAGIAVVVGPGSYTGLRIGLALARGLALVDELAVVPFGSLELMAMTAAPSLPALRVALLDAGRGKLYAGAYRISGHRAEVVAEPEVVETDDIATYLDSGELAGALVCIEDEAGRWLPASVAASAVVVEAARASVAAGAALARLADGAGSTAESALPVYVGGSSARPNRNRVVRNDAIIK
jgi:tRNA threonylcarbamoyladenosine biosynthesis protein TsaB